MRKLETKEAATFCSARADPWLPFSPINIINHFLSTLTSCRFYIRYRYLLVLNLRLVNLGGEWSCTISSMIYKHTQAHTYTHLHMYTQQCCAALQPFSAHQWQHLNRVSHSQVMRHTHAWTSSSGAKSLQATLKNVCFQDVVAGLSIC